MNAQLQNRMKERQEREGRDRELDNERESLADNSASSAQLSLSPQRGRFQHQQAVAGPSNATPYTESLGGLSPLSDTDSSNPFLPPHTVQRILGSSVPVATSGSGITPTSAAAGFGFGHNSDIGRASLMQMSELSRRAAHLTSNGGAPASGGDGRLWSGMTFGSDAANPQTGQAGQSDLAQPKLSRAEALAQIRNLHRERITQGGWANAPAVPSTTVGLAAAGMRRSHSEEREKQRERDRDRVGFSMSMAREDPSQSHDLQQGDEERGLAVRRRQSDNVLSHSTMDGVTMSGQEYGLPTQDSQSRELEASQRQQRQLPSRQESNTPNPNPWASLMSMGATPFVLDSQPFASGSGSEPGATPNFSSLTGADDDGTHEGLQVYTVGHLLPRGMGGEDMQGGWNFPPNSGGERSNQQDYSGDEETVQPTPSNSLIRPESSSSSIPITTPSNTTSPSSTSSSQKLRVRRSTFVPGWAVPPRVLLVDDDAVSRKLSSKFLQVFGCTIDVAVDGIAAVNKMNLEKYDLVLMDIVMPKLDGVSATNLIRKFDQGTPIISMTSNSKPNEIMTYYSSGMNDILPKPFTKEGLLDMLEVGVSDISSWFSR